VLLARSTVPNAALGLWQTITIIMVIGGDMKNNSTSASLCR